MTNSAQPLKRYNVVWQHDGRDYLQESADGAMVFESDVSALQAAHDDYRRGYVAQKEEADNLRADNASLSEQVRVAREAERKLWQQAIAEVLQGQNQQCCGNGVNCGDHEECCGSPVDDCDRVNERYQVLAGENK